MVDSEREHRQVCTQALKPQLEHRPIVNPPFFPNPDSYVSGDSTLHTALFQVPLCPVTVAVRYWYKIPHYTCDTTSSTEPRSLYDGIYISYSTQWLLLVDDTKGLLLSFA